MNNSFQDHLQEVKSAAQTAAAKTMAKAADEVKTFYEPQQDNVYDIGTSGEKNLEERRFLFL